MGLSMGAHNALAYAIAHPGRVSRLIAIDIPPRVDLRRAPNWTVISRLAETGHRSFASIEEALVEARAGNPTAPEENLRYRTERNVRDVDGGLQWKYDAKAPANWRPDDLSDQLTKITMPTLLVRGGKTTVLPRGTAEQMASAMPDAELVEISDSGHSVPTDRPERLLPVVLDWLRRRRLGARA
jgi:pimeloyl-ACP methyl ester carboxylesterase